MKEEFPKKLENEAQIVEHARTDNNAFKILYNFYFPKIYRYILKRVGDKEIAEDIVSTTFLKVFTCLEKYSYQGHSFGAWVYRIATNNLIDYYRKKPKQAINIENIEDLKDDRNPEPGNTFDKEKEKEKTRKMLEFLPSRYQEVIYLKFFANMTSNEISKIMNITENNMRVLVFRALKKIREQYKKHEE